MTLSCAIIVEFLNSFMMEVPIYGSYMIETAAKKKFRMLGVALVSLSQAYSEPREIIKTKICGKVKKGFHTLTIFAKKTPS